jgi:hypothetical protein
MNSTETAPEMMDLGFNAQRAYCERLGLIPAGPAGQQVEEWYRNPDARQVSALLAAMETQRGKILSARTWMLDNMAQVERRFEGAEVHTVNMNSGGEVARFAIEYDMAVAAYCALQDQLKTLVQRIRTAQGYEVDAFCRLEDHPTVTAEEDQAVRALRKAEDHLTDFRNYAPASQRRHLRGDHGVKVTAATEEACPLTGQHEQQHAAELAALRARVAAIGAA